MTPPVKVTYTLNPWKLIGKGNGKGRPSFWVLLAQMQASKLRRTR